MSLLTKETDLLQFINQKTQKEIDVSSKKILTNYCKVITNSIIKCYEKIAIGKYCIICLETIHHLFWILFLYSKNLKLTMFLCDRAILLFNEYIIMTKKTNLTHTNKDSINIVDVKSFVYKKTIGPIILNKGFNNNYKIKWICLIFRQLYINYTIYFMKNENEDIVNINGLSNALDNIYMLFSDILLNIENINDNCLKKYDNSENVLLYNIINEFIEIDDFQLLTIPSKNSSIFLLLKLYQIKIEDETFNISRYYNKILLLCESKYKHNSLKKEILNINNDEFFKLLQ